MKMTYEKNDLKNRSDYWMSRSCGIEYLMEDNKQYGYFGFEMEGYVEYVQIQTPIVLTFEI